MKRAIDKVSSSHESDAQASYFPPGRVPPRKEVEWVRNPDGDVMIDHKGRPVSVDRILATKPLRAELSTRPGPGGKKLTYMSGEGVTRLLNDIFGYTGWCLEIKSTTREECIKDEKQRYHVAYTAIVRLTHKSSGAFKEDCGAGDAIDKSIGTAIANALKASCTDAMKRAARQFGDKLGNSLYQDKFSASKAPATLAGALDQYEIERANAKFGFPKDQAKPKQNTAPVLKAPASKAPASNLPMKISAKPPVKQESIAAKNNVPSTTTAAAATVATVGPPKGNTKPPLTIQPTVTPQNSQPTANVVGTTAPATVTPHNASKQAVPPPTPGQGLQSSNLFGLGKFSATSNTEAEFDKALETFGLPTVRPGTSTGRPTAIMATTALQPPTKRPTTATGQPPKRQSTNPYITTRQ